MLTLLADERFTYSNAESQLGYEVRPAFSLLFALFLSVAFESFFYNCVIENLHLFLERRQVSKNFDNFLVKQNIGILLLRLEPLCASIFPRLKYIPYLDGLDAMVCSERGSLPLRDFQVFSDDALHRVVEFCLMLSMQSPRAYGEANVLRLPKMTS